MREIKFRVWDSSESKMIYLDDQSMSVEINFLNNWTYNHKTYWEVVTKEGEPGYPHMSQYVDSRRTENKIMQYTGLEDKNGKEIYEGDIVDFKSYPLSEVVYVRDRFTPIYDRSSYDEWEFDFWRISNDCEVVGNIYENPELLEGEK
jgi:uncharacterized phage protein (TIGR01671 family)